MQRLLDAGPQRSAWGVNATLRALWESRVATLVVDDMFRHARGALPIVHRLVARAAGTLPGLRQRCVIDSVEDVVELAIEQTLDEDGAFEMVRGAAARQMPTPIGPMAASLRW